MKKIVCVLIIVLFLVIGNVSAKDTLSNQSGYSLLKDIQEKTYTGGSKIIIVMDKQPDFVPYELSSPFRVTIDPVTPVFCNLSKDLTFEKGLVSRVKIIEGREERPAALDKDYYSVDFIIFELREPSSYKISQQDHSIALELGVSEEEVVKAMREWSEILKNREWTFWSPFKKAKLTVNATTDMEYNDNFYGTNRITKHVPKLVTKLYPEFWFGMPLSRDPSRLRINIYYKPTVTHYNNIGHFWGPYSDSDYYVNPTLVYTSPKSSFTLSNIYIKSERVDILDNNILRNYDDSWQDSASADFRYNFNNKNSLRLFYRFYVLQYPDIGLYEKWIEESQEISSTLETRLNATTTAYLTGELKKYLRKTDFDSLSKNTIFGIRHRFLKSTDTEMRVTFTSTDFFNGIGNRKDQDTLVVLGIVSGPLTKRDSLYFTYSFVKGYYDPPYLEYSAYLSFSHRFLWEKATTMSFATGYTYDDFYLQTTNKKTLASTFGLTHAMTKWLQTELWYSYSLRTGVTNDRFLNNRLRLLLRYIF